MKNTRIIRMTSCLLALLMLFSAVPQTAVPVFAQEEGAESEAMTGEAAVSQVLLQSESEEQKPLAGKTIACVGDSITAAYGVTKDETDYVTLLAQRLGMNYIRLGDSGTTLCTDGSRVCNIRRLTEDQLQGADVVTIAMGINDFCNAAGDYYKLGDINTTDTSTIYGAARMWCQRIAELRKTDSLSNTQFYFVTPVITSWNNSVTSARDWDQSKKNVHGYTLRDLCNAIIEVAELYEVPVIDLNLLSGMYYVDAEDQNTAVFGGDGVHPGVKGHEMMAHALANVLLQNHLRNDHEHTFGSWITTTWPSCAPEEQQRICSICSAAERRMAEPNDTHSYIPAVTPPTCTEQGYTTYTCTACGDSYISDTTELVWHSYSDDQCSMCGNEMLRVSLEDIVRFQGGVNSADGTLNTTFTNNWYADIPIPEGAEQVRFLVFKTGGSWGSAFLKGSTYLSGFCDKTSGGYWMSVDVPEDATIFRYGYLYDQSAAQAGYPTFAYLEFVGEELTIQESSGSPERPATGCHSFSVKVNIAPAQGKPDGYVEGTDYGYIQLPTNYTSYGEPTRLIIVCHGAGTDLGTYRSDAWKNTNYSFWTDLGYAVMDMYACPPELTGNNDCLHYGNPVVLECYQEGYDYVMEHFNLKKDGIFLIGASMGGLSSFQIAQSGEFPVIAQVGYCPVIDLFKQAYVNPWTTASYQRSRIAQYFGFTDTAPAFTNAQFPSGEEIVYYKDNFCKTISYSPILSNVVSGDLEGLFDVIPASATAMSPEEEALYQKLTATHPNPLMIFHNTDDATVSYRYSQYFVDMVNRSGQEAILRTFPSGGHNAWANGNDHTVQGLNGTITIKDSQYEAYLFFKKYEEHESHIGWVDPAMAPTCTTAGLTEGSHCAACGEVLLKQEIVSATGHDFTDYRPNGDGTLTGHCSRCGEPDTLPDPAIRCRINSIAVADEAGAPQSGIPAGVCQVTVSVTKVAMEGDFVLWLAAYTAQEQFVCMVPLAVEDLAAGETKTLTAQLDNTAGLMGNLKAFCVESCEKPAPQGLEKAFLPQ